MNDCPLLDYLKKHGVPRSELAYRWLEYNFGEIPEFIGGETLETIPSEIEEEVNLIVAKSPGGIQ